MIWDFVKAAFISTGPDGSPNSLSFSSAFPCHVGILYEVNYYGDADVSTILAHVIKHLETASQSEKNTKLVFSFMCYREVANWKTLGKVQDFCNKLMHGKVGNNNAVLAQIVMELPNPDS